MPKKSKNEAEIALYQKEFDVQSNKAATVLRKIVSSGGKKSGHYFLTSKKDGSLPFIMASRSAIDDKGELVFKRGKKKKIAIAVLTVGDWSFGKMVVRNGRLVFLQKRGRANPMTTKNALKAIAKQNTKLSLLKKVVFSLEEAGETSGSVDPNMINASDLAYLEMEPETVQKVMKKLYADPSLRSILSAPNQQDISQRLAGLNQLDGGEKVKKVGSAQRLRSFASSVGAQIGDKLSGLMRQTNDATKKMIGARHKAASKHILQAHEQSMTLSADDRATYVEQHKKEVKSNHDATVAYHDAMQQIDQPDSKETSSLQSVARKQAAVNQAYEVFMGFRVTSWKGENKGGGKIIGVEARLAHEEAVVKINAILNDQPENETEEQKKDRIARAEAVAWEQSLKEIRRIFREELEEKLEELGHPKNEERFLREAQAAADEWWEDRPARHPKDPPIKGAKNNPSPVINTTGVKTAVEQYSLHPSARESAELFRQLYYDAAKAQKRLGQIGEELAGNERIKVSMPSIKGTVRATYKTWLPTNQKYEELLMIPDDELTEAQATELKMLRDTLYGEEEEDKYQPFVGGLRDLSRGTVEVPNLSEIPAAVSLFMAKAKEKCPGVEITRFKNKFVGMYTGQDDTGYADIQIHFRLDGGHICEMQFNCKSMLDFKSFGGSRRGVGDEGQSQNPARDWKLLLGYQAHKLRTAGEALNALDIDTMLTKGDKPVPKVVGSMQRIKDGMKDDVWRLNAHVIFDITRWLERASVVEPVAENQKIKDRVVSTLNDLSKAGSHAFRSVIAAADGKDFDVLLKEIAQYSVRLGPSGERKDITLPPLNR